MGTERRLVIALSLLSDLFEAALGSEELLEELRPIDREVLIQHADCAGRHVTNALFIHRPDLAKLAPSRRVVEMDRLFLRYPYELESEELEWIAFRAYEELDQLLDARKRSVRLEVDHAMCHLDVVLFVLDPDMYSRSIEDASADDRVRLAAQAEQVELMLEESRAIISEDAFDVPEVYD